MIILQIQSAFWNQKSWNCYTIAHCTFDKLSLEEWALERAGGLLLSQSLAKVNNPDCKHVYLSAPENENWLVGLPQAQCD